MSNKDKLKANEIIAHLVERFPRCFFLDGVSRRPLKLNIYTDLAPLALVGEKDLQAALRRYCSRHSYLRVCVKGASRVDIDGNVVGEVTAKEAAWAAQIIAERERSNAEKKAAKRALREQERLKKMAVRKQQRQPRRVGLADLRAAAAKRREAAGGA